MITLDGYALAEELQWTDKYMWSRVKASIKRSIQGKLLIRETCLPSDAGRPMTLTADHAWMQRSDVDAIYELAQLTEATLTIVLNDAYSYHVKFRHWEDGFFDVVPLMDSAFPNDATWYRVALKLVLV